LKVEFNLPDRNEFIVFCELTPEQLKLYENYLILARDYMKEEFHKPEAFGILNNMRKICNHPFLFFSYMESEKG